MLVDGKSEDGGSDSEVKGLQKNNGVGWYSDDSMQAVAKRYCSCCSTMMPNHDGNVNHNVSITTQDGNNINVTTTN